MKSKRHQRNRTAAVYIGIILSQLDGHLTSDPILKEEGLR